MHSDDDQTLAVNSGMLLNNRGLPIDVVADSGQIDVVAIGEFAQCGGERLVCTVVE